VAALAARIDWRAIAVDREAGTLAKARDGVRADLSGIAKGYGVDLAARSLDALGATDYMVEAGGEVRVRGRNADGKPWRIGIERRTRCRRKRSLWCPWTGSPWPPRATTASTSSRAGRRFSHEIDPATREPVRGSLASVSVVAKDCGWADAMATALFVMGAERGRAFAVEHGSLPASSNAPRAPAHRPPDAGVRKPGRRTRESLTAMDPSTFVAVFVVTVVLLGLAVGRWPWARGSPAGACAARAGAPRPMRRMGQDLLRRLPQPPRMNRCRVTEG